MVEAAVIEVAAVEVVTIDDRSAVGDVGVVVVDHPVAMPIAAPVMPAPAKSSKEADSKSDTEGDCWAVKKDSWHGIPAWICNYRLSIYEPRIVGRHVDHVRVGRFDDDSAALSRYLLLFIGT